MVGSGSARFHEAFLSAPVLLWRVRAADDSWLPPMVRPAWSFLRLIHRMNEVGRAIPAGGRHAAQTGGEASRGGKGPFNAPPVFPGQRGSKHRSCSDVQQR